MSKSNSRVKFDASFFHPMQLAHLLESCGPYEFCYSALCTYLWYPGEGRWIRMTDEKIRELAEAQFNQEE